MLTSFGSPFLCNGTMIPRDQSSGKQPEFKITLNTSTRCADQKPETTILYKTYTMLKNKVNIGCTDSNNWAYRIKLILDRSGFSNIWLLQHTSPYLVNLIKTRILNNYYQSWYANINNTSKLETYCLIKHTLDLKSIWIL